MTVLETAKRAGLDRRAYLHDLLVKLSSGWLMSQLDELLPGHWTPAPTNQSIRSSNRVVTSQLATWSRYALGGCSGLPGLQELVRLHRLDTGLGETAYRPGFVIDQGRALIRVGPGRG